MLKLLPLLPLCVACTPASDNREETATPTVRSYATQASAPSPDYRALLKVPVPAAESRQELDATSPLPPNAKPIGDAWIARLEKRGALLGYGLAGNGPDGPVRLITTGLTEKEFASWTNEDGWHVYRGTSAGASYRN